MPGQCALLIKLMAGHYNTLHVNDVSLQISTSTTLHVGEIRMIVSLPKKELSTNRSQTSNSPMHSQGKTARLRYHQNAVTVVLYASQLMTASTLDFRTAKMRHKVKDVPLQCGSDQNLTSLIALINDDL